MNWPLACVRPTEPLCNHTSFRIGGPAEWFAEPETIDELQLVLREAARQGLPVSIIGGGTNLLVADEGVRGVVIHLGKQFRQVEIISAEADPIAVVRCGASLLTQRLVLLAGQYGWGDLELLAGLPGQLGGAVMMNAQQIGRFVKQVRLVRFDGGMMELPQDQVHFTYRYTAMDPGIVADVLFEFPKIPVQVASERIQQALRYRNTTQDLNLPSAGCAFKNPEGQSAGRLIDQAGLKGARIGDARISLRHANFIVNVGQASCQDVLSLMEHVQRQVEREFGIHLEPEVRLLGARWDARI